MVHPDQPEFLPLAPEPIHQAEPDSEPGELAGPSGDSQRDSDQEGAMNDCESQAIRRLITQLRQEHPRLKIVVLADELHSNAPGINLLKKHHMSFIIVAKPNNHGNCLRMGFAFF